MSSSARSSTSSRSAAKACPRIELAEIQRATNNFDDGRIIRRGEFGITYKGKLDSGETVAVKRLDKNSNIVEEFRNEIQILSKFPSDYLVPIRGKCEESKEMILVHEFMHNGSLADHLYKEGDGIILSWDQRVSICIDVARGLDYLHNGCAGSKRIIHRNIKPENILLDEYWSAKISEFGYAKTGLANTKNSAVYTNVVGTDAYLDPYYNLTGQLTRRTDIYSFGVVMFEVLCGRPAFDAGLDSEQQKLSQWAKKCYEKGTLGKIIDTHLKGISQDSLKAFADVAYSCLNDNPTGRPKMTDVVDKLDSILKKAQPFA